MSQISPPIRILLISAIALMAAWMLFLRPKTEVVEPVTATPAPNVDTGQPAVSDPGKVAQAAKDAAAATNAKTEATEAATQTGATPAPSTAVKPSAPAADGVRPATGPRTDVDVKGLPKVIAKAVTERKVVALLFWNPRSADDRAVRRAMRGVDTWKGEVVTHTAPIKRVSRYASITRGADVAQSPTVVVIDRDLHAETLVGFVDTATIDQAVVDAMRSSGVLISSPYLRQVNELCANSAIVGFGAADPSQGAELTALAQRQRGVVRRLNTRFTALKAPARFRGFKRATVRDHTAMAALYAEWATFLGPKPSVARVGASLTRFGGRERTIGKRYDRRMDRQHLLACGSQA